MMARERVLVTGMGIASPIGHSPEEVFDSFESCQSAIGPIRRFDASRLQTRVAGEIDIEALVSKIGRTTCDVPALGLSLPLIENPKLTFALWACAQALGVDLESYVTAGADFADVALYTTAGLEEIRLQALWSPLAEDTHVCGEFPPAFVGEVLCQFFAMNQHPPVTMVSACTSSTQSIGEAFRAIRAGDMDCALAGGTDSMIYPFGINAFNSLQALATGGGSECTIAPFDGARRGTLLGEGSAFFRLESARSIRMTGHVPLCEITGYASSLDGHHPVKPHPDGAGAARAMKRALDEARITRVDYVNAHGSGTFHNDVAETRALHTAFGPAVRTLKVSSTKPYHGHLLTAGGAIELASLIFAFDRGRVPPTLNLKTPDRDCDLDYVAGKPESLVVETAMSNSFGLNGQNGVLVLRAIAEEAHE